ncbi:outer membrane protein A precursor [Methylophaga lonarensis MPL]|uniref:Outer membrane protein A n=1 Tax=Methylophaga lonarensis MPL TaxID=1286106 RepID=M7P0Z6_9GAMM|nr:OmpA family protein [Methylophaga lonarensis]EMR13152.1 outer membrane protein A precursor [Methylophaga lonarensis MPL]
MNLFTKMTAAVLSLGLLAGCAGPNQRSSDNYLLCSAAGALVGGAAGAATSSSSGQAAAGGAIVGGMLALLLCPNDKVEAAPVVEEAPVVCEIEPVPGALLDARGCAMDSDGDGVVDGIDQCPGTPAGVQVDSVGCPLDSDGDGVPDYRDLCPGTPQGMMVDKDGCPIKDTVLLSLTGVTFEFDSAKLTPAAERTLGQAVTALRDTDERVEVRVEGHTDSVGSADYNLRLSQQRAESVVDYLVSQGITRHRLIPVGMGEGYPVADNTTAEGRALNRRVEFIVNN